MVTQWLRIEFKHTIEQSFKCEVTVFSPKTRSLCLSLNLSWIWKNALKFAWLQMASDYNWFINPVLCMRQGYWDLTWSQIRGMASGWGFSGRALAHGAQMGFCQSSTHRTGRRHLVQAVRWFLKLCVSVYVFSLCNNYWLYCCTLFFFSFNLNSHIFLLKER